MKSTTLPLILIFSTLASLNLFAQQKTGDNYQPFEYLIGSWKNDFAITVFEWGPNQSYIHWYADRILENRPKLRAMDGIIAWDREKEQYYYFLTLNNGKERSIMIEKGFFAINEEEITRYVDAFYPQSTLVPPNRKKAGEAGARRYYKHIIYRPKKEGDKTLLTQSVFRSDYEGNWMEHFPGSAKMESKKQ